MSNLQPAHIIAKLFNRTDRRIQQLARDGVIPKPQDGKYDMINCCAGYIRYLQNKLAEKDAASGGGDRKQLLKLQCEKLALEIKASNKEVLPTDQVVGIWSNMLLKLRSRILALPYRAAPLLLNMGKLNEIQKILKDLVHEALIELSELDPGECEVVTEADNNNSSSDVATKDESESESDIAEEEL